MAREFKAADHLGDYNTAVAKQVAELEKTAIKLFYKKGSKANKLWISLLDEIADAKMPCPESQESIMQTIIILVVMKPINKMIINNPLNKMIYGDGIVDKMNKLVEILEPHHQDSPEINYELGRIYFEAKVGK